MGYFATLETKENTPIDNNKEEDQSAAAAGGGGGTRRSTRKRKPALHEGLYNIYFIVCLCVKSNDLFIYLPCF